MNINKQNVILGTIGAMGFFVLGALISPVFSHYVDNNRSVTSAMPGYYHQDLAYGGAECPMHQEFERRAGGRGAYFDEYGGHRRGMMRGY